MQSLSKTSDLLGASGVCQGFVHKSVLIFVKYKPAGTNNLFALESPTILSGLCFVRAYVTLLS